jgi:Cys-tRNA synthase (O-phospho-L-seryl-tRNA:Cys-tRNA synthase)
MTFKMTTQLSDRAKASLDNVMSLIGDNQTKVVIDALLHYERYCLAKYRPVAVHRRNGVT